MHFFYFDFVENNSQHALPDIVSTPQRPLNDVHLRFAPFNDHEIIANEGRRRTYVHYRDQRRKVDDHIVILSMELLNKILHLSGGQKRPRMPADRLDGTRKEC
jgi:hypothetical protein